MAELTVLPFEKKVKTLPGETVLDALRRGGFHPESPCNGKGSCGKCRITVADPADVPETPHKMLSSKEAAKGVRLACRLPADKDIILTLPPSTALEAKVLEGAELTGMSLNPAAVVRKTDNGFVLAYPQQEEKPLTDWNEGDIPAGLAIDIGTTTVVVSRYNLVTGETLGTASGINPQTEFGHDVLTRIQKGSTEQGLKELADCIREKLNDLTLKTGDDVDPKTILDVVLAGNTTMLQLIGMINPEPLGRVPFTVGIKAGQSFPASDFGLTAHPQARVYVPPVSHAYVGADITAGMLAAGFFNEEKPALFIDIGTNGEMGIIHDKNVVVASTAAGPAFEGMGISCGTRAAPGAVEAVFTAKDEIKVQTIDDKPANGICGSGLIDLVAVLLKHHLIDSGGRMQENPEKNLTEEDDQLIFRISDGVYFSQGDVRQLQLAKSAVRTGIDMLMEERGLKLEDLDKVVLAGAFGFHLRPSRLEDIGLLPEGFAHKVVFAGNTSKTGAAKLLLDKTLRALLEDKAEEIVHLPLAEGVRFQDFFIQNLSFP